VAVSNDDVRQTLAAQRTAALGQINALQREVAEIVDAVALVATDDEHDPEGATIAFERARMGALLDQARDTLAAVDQALRRLDDDRYGQCEICGRSIPAERLAARPHTRTCVTCAATPERR
jgi:DnaK suppressor protein